MYERREKVTLTITMKILYDIIEIASWAAKSNKLNFGKGRQSWKRLLSADVKGSS
jgi:hypothetical protein